jgi:hypothetical protein
VNPTAIIGSIATIFGIGSSMVNQGINIHRELKATPQQQAQVQQQCPPPFKLVVVIAANGQRQLMCIQEQEETK